MRAQLTEDGTATLVRPRPEPCGPRTVHTGWYQGPKTHPTSHPAPCPYPTSPDLSLPCPTLHYPTSPDPTLHCPTLPYPT